MTTISQEQRQLQADAREEILKEIARLAKKDNNPSSVKVLAEAYALVVAPQGAPRGAGSSSPS